MRWFLGIPFTMALLIACEVIARGIHEYLRWVPILVTAVWAAFDSRKLAMEGYAPRLANHPFDVFVLVALFWILAFPWYLHKRYRLRSGTGGAGPSDTVIRSPLGVRMDPGTQRTLVPPWQIQVSVAVSGLLVAFCVSAVLMALAPVMAYGVYAIAHLPFGLISIKLGLPLVLLAVLIALDILWALSVLWLWQGRKWGLVSGLGSITVVAPALGLFLASRGDNVILVSWLAPLVVVAGGTVALLISPAARQHCRESSISVRWLTTKGILLGGAFAVSIAALSFAAVQIAEWIDVEQMGSEAITPEGGRADAD